MPMMIAYFWSTMKFKCLLFLGSLLIFLGACRSGAKIHKEPADIVEQLMKKNPEEFGDILRKRDSFRVQVIYTQIDRNQKNKPVFTNYYFNVDAGKYYYPASTVKLPTALLALEKLNKLQIAGLNPKTSMITEVGFSNESPVYNDPSSEDGRPTIEQYVKKIFLVSDNDAFNRLYEFLGQEYINEKLHNKGYKGADILHRLSIFLTEEENRHTNPVRFFDDSTREIFSKPLQFNKHAYPQREDSIGSGYYSGGKLISQPMNFSRKNKLPLEELHAIMKSVMFPASVKNKQRFNLTSDQYRFVWQYLSESPLESRYPEYDSVNYWDAYGKFLYWGSDKAKLPKTIRSFSKEGDAYGFLIDAAYLVDFEKNIEFMLSAVIYCNSDGVLNDDKYDYDSVGLPFMKNLGRLIYDHELKRPRTRQPDLSTFRLDYKN